MSFECITLTKKELKNMNTKDYILDLYEIELYKKSIYEDGIGTNQPKPNREREFTLVVEHIAILNELLDLLEDD